MYNISLFLIFTCSYADALKPYTLLLFLFLFIHIVCGYVCVFVKLRYFYLTSVVSGHPVTDTFNKHKHKHIFADALFIPRYLPLGFDVQQLDTESLRRRRPRFQKNPTTTWLFTIKLQSLSLCWCIISSVRTMECIPPRSDESHIASYYVREAS